MNSYYRFKFIALMRQFFINQNFMEVMTPPIVENPGMEVHIHPFKVESTYSESYHSTKSFFLQTSPEFAMKKILCESNHKELSRIFNISYCFRDEPNSTHHRKQFIMIEWYRQDAYYHQLKTDCLDLINYIIHHSPPNLPIKSNWKKSFNVYHKTVAELFTEIVNIDLFNFLETKEIKKLIEKDFSRLITLPKETCPWEDYFFLLFLNLIEPKLRDYPVLFLDEYPAPLCALATLKKENPLVAERFELYIDGIEIANCFNELTNYEQQKKRFEEAALSKMQLYQYQLPAPQEFYHTMQNGLPKSSGIALGIERLMGQLIEITNPFWD